jgi:hypothetical protein
MAGHHRGKGEAKQYIFYLKKRRILNKNIVYYKQ